MLMACNVPRHSYGELVGRESERRALLALIDSVDSAGSAAMVIGEAGMGKTALLTQLAASAAARAGTKVIWLRGEESEAVLAFAALADLLLPLRGHFTRLPEGQRLALEACLALSVVAPRGPLAVCVGALGVLAAAAEQAPLVILVDDFQWIDPESRKILQFIARRVPAEPIVMIIAIRDEPGAPVVTAGLPEVRLSGLGYDDCAELARQRRIAVAPDKLRSLVQRSGGNPLVVLENLASAADPASFPRDEQLVLHSSVARVWHQVLMQLPAATRRALFVMAASHGADPADLSAALNEVGLSLESLGPAERRGLVRMTEDGARLCHPLLRSVVVEHTHMADRIQVYKALARASAGSLRAWYQAAAATGPDEAAAEALVTAAEDARRRGGYGGAARAWRRAAELSTTGHHRVVRLLNAASDAFLAGDPRSAVTWCEEALCHCRDPVLTADIKLTLGRARTWMGDPHRSHDDLVQAAVMIQPLDTARAANLLAEATLPAAIAGQVQLMLEMATKAESLWQSTGTLLGSGTIPPPALAMVAESFVLAGMLDRADLFLSLAEKSLSLADPAGEQQSSAYLGQSLIAMERYGQAGGHLNAVIDTARQKGAPAVLAIALAGRSDLGWWNGHWAAAYADATESLQWAEEMGVAAAMGYSLVLLARIDAARGDQHRCAVRTERARREVEMRGVGCLAVYNAAALGLSALGGGDVTAAVDHLERAWEAARTGGLDNPNVVPFGGDLAEAMARAGDIARASEILTWLEGSAAATGLRYPAMAAARGRAVIAEDPAAAGEWFGRALSACEDPPVPFEQARTLLCQGESLRRARQPTAARKPLRQALVIFRSLGAQPWITRAATELGAAGVRGSGERAVEGSRLDALTPQELQTARAVGRGLNNVEAAAALFVSPKTVEAHLTRAYRKLGVRSRTELARLLLTHDASG